MKNKSRKSTFRKMTKMMNGILGKYFRNTKDSYKYFKRYNFRNHIYSMLYLQLSGSESLRDMTSKYKNHKKVTKEFAVPSYSQLSRLNAQKDCSIFRDIYLDMLKMAKDKLNPNYFNRNFKDIKIIDSTLILLGSNLAPKLFYQCPKSAVRVSTLLSFGTKIPEKITIVPGSIGERNCIEDYFKDKESIYVFDMGYSKYSWYDDLSKDNISFVTRLVERARTEEISSRYTGIDDLYDITIKIGSDHNKNKTSFEYREILYFEDGKDKEYILLTNIFDLPPEEIVRLYKLRWNIECFFKWIKQHLTIKHLLGHNLNSISIQIYCALILYILLIIIKETFKSPLTVFDILRKLRANINETYALRNILSG